MSAIEAYRKAVKAADEAGGMIADEAAFLIAQFDENDNFGSQVHSGITTETPKVRSCLDDIRRDGIAPKPTAIIVASREREREDPVGLMADCICRMHRG